MASFEASASQSKEPAAALTQSFSIPVSTSNVNSANDSDEWEYEYSATETETFYLTLDLTNPLSLSRRPKLPLRSKGRTSGSQLRWTNTGLGRHKRQLGRAPNSSFMPAKFTIGGSVSTPTVEDEGNGEDEAIAEAVPNAVDDAIEDGGADEGARLAGEEIMRGVPGVAIDNTATTEKSEATGEPEQIQILDLHEENPIIAYRGQVFSCRWAQNVGTELLFTAHDSASNLFKLRSLNGDVDLLAASSARLISTPVELVPKTQGQNTTNTPIHEVQSVVTSRNLDEATDLIDSIGKGASDTRKAQGEFLQRLINIKRRKGEPDAVTVNTQRRLRKAGWRTEVKGRRDQERAQLQRIIDKGGSGALNAQKRLEHMNMEDAKRAEEDDVRKNGRVTMKAGSKPSDETEGQRGLSSPKPAISRGERPAGSSGSAVGEQDMLSTPTPQRWEDLQSGRTNDDFNARSESEDVVMEGL